MCAPPVPSLADLCAEFDRWRRRSLGRGERGFDEATRAEFEIAYRRAREALEGLCSPAGGSSRALALSLLAAWEELDAVRRGAWAAREPSPPSQGTADASPRRG